MVYNQPWISYPVSVAYRENGAYEASNVGGVASLIRSIAPFSIYSPHTGWQVYRNGTAKIPTACITVEDAEMLSRMAARGDKIVIHLFMGARNLPPASSRNTVAEIVGSSLPEEVCNDFLVNLINFGHGRIKKVMWIKINQPLVYFFHIQHMLDKHSFNPFLFETSSLDG